jgi:hypothetical protein
MTPDQAGGLLLVLGMLIFVVLPLAALAWRVARVIWELVLYTVDRLAYERRRWL